MHSRRRQLLGLFGTAGLGALAGCLGFGSDDSDETDTARPAAATDGTTPTATPTATLSPEPSPTGATDSSTPMPTATATATPTATATATPTATPTPASEFSTDPQKLTAADGEEDDKFSEGVAMSADGTTAVFGAPGDSAPSGSKAGAVYVFRRADDGWQETTKLTALDRDGTDQFGRGVGVSGDGTSVVVGAPEDESPNGNRAGSAYAFRRTNGEWREETKLAAADGDARDFFGESVTVSGDGTTAVVGAFSDEDPNGDLGGSAYVFRRTNGEWREETKLAATDGLQGNFSGSLDISRDGTTMIAGAPIAEATYVFRRRNTEWQADAKLTASDGEFRDKFGSSVTLSDDGTTAIVGVSDDNEPNGEDGGSAYVFRRTDGEWREETKIAAGDPNTFVFFGESVAVSGDGTTAVVGANGDDDPNGDRAGSAYVFRRADAGWRETRKLIAPDGDSRDLFGSSVSLSSDGTTAIVGAYDDEDPHGDEAGSAYVFETA